MMALILSACGSIGSPSATATPQPTATPQFTPTPEPTSTPISLYGIDEPAILENVQFDCSISELISEDPVDVAYTFTNAEFRDSISIQGQDEDVFPSVGNTFYRVYTEIDVLDSTPCTDMETIAKQLALACGAVLVQPRTVGLYINMEGEFNGFTFTFEIPADIEVSTCEVLLSDGSSVPVGQAFE